MSLKTFILTFVLNLVVVTNAHASWLDALKAAEFVRTAQDANTMLAQAQNISENELEFWKSILVAEAHTLKNNPKDALTALSSLLQQPKPEASYTDDGYAWLYKRALIASFNAKKALGQNTTFEESTLLTHYPLDEALLATLNSSVSLTREQKIQRLKVLSINSAYKKIKDALSFEDILQSTVSETEKCAAFVLYGRALKSFSEASNDAIRALKTTVKSSACSEDQKAKALFYLGNIGKTTQNPELLVEAYEDLSKHYSKHYLADDALNALANFYKSTQPTLSQKYLNELDESKMGDTRTDYFFSQGFDLYKNKKYKESIKAFDKANQTLAPINETYVQALYWKAKALEAINPPKPLEAKEIYKNIIQDYPFSFYAVLSSKQINLAVSAQLPALNKNSPSLENQNSYFKFANALIQAREMQLARVMIDMALIQNPEIKTTHPQDLAQFWIDAENYRESIELASQHFGTGPYGPVAKTNDPMISAFYPQVYKNETHKGHAVSGLPFGAIEGISREESLFKKDATSWVGAKGLMQLMPATARMIQGEVLAHTPTTELTHPLNNILLGSHYLKLMKNKFSGQMPLAIMAYNAGPGNVNKWLRKASADKKLQDLDMFIEEIPFDETRGYVKRVMRSMNVYGHLYNEEFFKKNQFSLSIKNSGDV